MKTEPNEVRQVGILPSFDTPHIRFYHDVLRLKVAGQYNPGQNYITLGTVPADQLYVVQQGMIYFWQGTQTLLALMVTVGASNYYLAYDAGVAVNVQLRWDGLVVAEEGEVLKSRVDVPGGQTCDIDSTFTGYIVKLT